VQAIEIRLVEGVGHTATWIIIFLMIFYAAAMAVFVRYIGEVLRALLAERDPELKEILRQTLRDLLEPLRRGKRR
jgi:type IV secretory pathway TrbD component